MIRKNDIPILEYDTDTIAVIMPTHENLANVSQILFKSF